MKIELIEANRIKSVINKSNIRKRSYCRDLIANIEKTLHEKIKNLSRKLNKNRNIKNTRPNHQRLNNERSKKRKNIKLFILQPTLLYISL